MPAARIVGTLSGGVGSWAACRLWIDQHGAEGVTLLFADTGEEHPDTIRFLHDAAADLAVPLVEVTAGTDIWEVFRAHRWIGNSKLAHCSWDLKTEPSCQWIERNAPETETVLVGIDATEDKRLPDIVAKYAPRTVRAPLAERGWWKARARDLAERRGLRPSMMYSLGFAHANCIGCVKAGQGHWLTVLERFPERYARHEREEARLRAELGQGAILRDWRNGGVPMTLTELRERAQRHDPQLDTFEQGGCACF